MTVGSRIRAARKAAKLSQEALAERLGYAEGQGQTTISSWERGRTEPTREDVQAIADALHVPLRLIELADDTDRVGFPLVGKVGAGGQGLYEDDYEKGAALEYIEPLPGMPIEADIIVLETDGDSMTPMVYDGDLAFFGPIRHDVETLVNQRVMARLADGRKFFKILKRSPKPGRFTLRSTNPAVPDIEDVEVTWVLPYQGSRPRRVWR